MQLRGLWRHPDFLKLWAGETISVFGSLIGRTALPFTAILVLDARPYQIAVLTAADIVPQLLMGLIAGVWVDRLRRRPLMIVSDIARAALLVSIPVAYAFDALVIEHLYVVGLFVGMLTIFFDVAYLSYLPSLVKKEELLEGNSKLAASSAIAEVGAFGSVGWLVQLLSGPVTILIDAISFLFSALFVGLIRKPEPPPKAVEDREGVRREVVEGLRAIGGSPVLRAIAGSEVIVEFSFRVFGVVFMLYATRSLGFEPGVLGLTFAIGGISSFVGAIAAGRVAGRLGIGPSMAYGRMLMGACMVVVPLATDSSLLSLGILAALQLGDGCYMVADINQISLRQSITPEHVLGRVNATIRFVTLAAMLLGVLAGGVLGEVAGLRATLVVGAAGTFLSGLWFVASPVWRTRAAPTHERTAAVPLAVAFIPPSGDGE